jgi:hypothetical protein
MKVKASIVVMSHLSDVQEAIDMKLSLPLAMNSNLNFAKYVILQTKGDLNQEIDADALWKAFMLTPYYKG